MYQCSDGIDNDGDGEIDLADDGCDSATDDDETDPASGNTYKVGPGRAYQTLEDALDSLNLEPGDVVEIDGDVTYSGGIRLRTQDGGSAQNPVVIRGISVNGNRPHIRGGTNVLQNDADYVVYDNLEISGTGNTSTGSFRCFFHKGTGIVIRNSYIHDCPRHGIQSADIGSGSLTVEYTRVTRAGSNNGNHALYITTDQVNYPGSVFRLQFSYISDSQFDDSREGGNLIKTRAERNEIYYNWLEGAYYHELELIGPDPYGVDDGWRENLVREDSDVVGNVFYHTSDFSYPIRIGGDGTGQTNGRVRFVHNTMIGVGGSQISAFRIFDGIDSLEANNNVFFNGGDGVRVFRDNEADWVTGSAKITGKNNWVESGASYLPDGFSGTIFGSNPNLDDNMRPNAGSPLLDAATAATSPGGYGISNPLADPAYMPSKLLQAVPRPATADIGAVER